MCRPSLCEALAREIAGTGANAEIQELARRVAEAQIDLRRVRYARHKLLSDALGDPYYDSRENVRRDRQGQDKRQRAAIEAFAKGGVRAGR